MEKLLTCANIFYGRILLPSSRLIQHTPKVPNKASLPWNSLFSIKYCTMAGVKEDVPLQAAEANCFPVVIFLLLLFLEILKSSQVLFALASLLVKLNVGKESMRLSK